MIKNSKTTQQVSTPAYSYENVKCIFTSVAYIPLTCRMQEAPYSSFNIASMLPLPILKIMVH